MLKKAQLSIALLFCLFQVKAQLKSNLRLDLEMGILDLSESENFGLFLNVEPKLKSSENTTLGLRIGITLNSITIENKDSLKFEIHDEADNGVISIVPTFDYHWYDLKYRPHLGVGVGCHLLGSYIEASQVDAPPTDGILLIKVNYQMGLLLRGGLAIRKLKLGLEYNYIPKAALKIPNGRTIGSVDYSYLGVSVGFSIGDWDTY